MDRFIPGNYADVLNLSASKDKIFDFTWITVSMVTYSYLIVDSRYFLKQCLKITQKTFAMT